MKPDPDKSTCLCGTLCKYPIQLRREQQSKCRPHKVCTQLFQKPQRKSQQGKECTLWNQQQSSDLQRRRRKSQRRWPRWQWRKCPQRKADTSSRQSRQRSWSTCLQGRTSRLQRRREATLPHTFRRDIPDSPPSWCCQCWQCTFQHGKVYTLHG
jgi:hypothetical protein